MINWYAAIRAFMLVVGCMIFVLMPDLLEDLGPRSDWATRIELVVKIVGPALIGAICIGLIS